MPCSRLCLASAVVVAGPAAPAPLRGSGPAKVNSMNERKPELEHVEQYLDNHFFPILERIQERIEDPQLVTVALRRTTRHIWHWQQDVEVPAETTPATLPPQSAATPTRQNGSNDHDREAAYEAAKDKAPEEWSTGDEPATPKQLAVLRDRGIPHHGGLTKAEASKLITQHVYKGARA